MHVSFPVSTAAKGMQKSRELLTGPREELWTETQPKPLVVAVHTLSAPSTDTGVAKMQLGLDQKSKFQG